MIKVEKLEPFPEKSNPFNYDWYQMGKTIATNVSVMFATFETDKAAHIDVINTETGERVRVHFGPGRWGKFIEEDHDDSKIEALQPKGMDFSK